MNSRSPAQQDAEPGAPDIGEYCRAVEAHLAHVNAGHLVRVVGVAFDLVRDWARAGIPLSVVRFGIDRKAERHRTGASKRPLRLEFCEGDVRTAFDAWRRAVGVAAPALPGQGESGASADAERRARPPSLSRQIARASERTVRAAGRLDTPADLREALTAVLEALVALQDRARHARGEAREGVARELAALDGQLLRAARTAAGGGLARLRATAAAELDPYRSRMPAVSWERSVEMSVDRLLRESYGLPTLDPEAMG